MAVPREEGVCLFAFAVAVALPTCALKYMSSSLGSSAEVGPVPAFAKGMRAEDLIYDDGGSELLGHKREPFPWPGSLGSEGREHRGLGVLYETYDAKIRPQAISSLCVILDGRCTVFDKAVTALSPRGEKVLPGIARHVGTCRPQRGLASQPRSASCLL
ncbi:hypothetical protein QBC46DRAFT_412661 [Diplogelasinospora grovesii]|uniref:Uncharacterized protein n=1 Tax=Diplogelasinospora grovesii TaxID=303347 RepID=A0AAN6MYF8_9PEZI|nr:hypothetical protein QBC46DRAFT_412661 [Diplogelasinospora grovesii]